MVQSVTFNKTGYDSFIDFIKAYAIIMVLFGHTYPNLDSVGYGLWAGMQVPLFVLVQCFHGLKKSTRPIVNFKRIILRIFLPFIVAQIVTLYFCMRILSRAQLLNEFIQRGGIGPGSYFPWVYLQVAMILPFAFDMCRRLTRVQLLLVFLIISESFEVLCSILNMPENVYRLLSIRYLFLIYLAYLWASDGIRINIKTIALSLFSMIAIVYFEYFSVNDEPLFYHTVWSFHRWPCYYYVAMGGTFLLHKLYEIFIRSRVIYKIVALLARCSYEIFLIQMSIIPLGYGLNLFIIDSRWIALNYVAIYFISILGGYAFHMCYDSLLYKFRLISR